MNVLLELADRVEAATGPDRDLDWTIHCRDGLWGVGLYGSHPAYTASLDAAISLVRKSLNALGLRIDTQTTEAGSWVRITWLQDGFSPQAEGQANTLELALTAASLRAIAAAQHNEGEE